MDVKDALRAVEVIAPQTVILVHHNWDILFYHRPADVDDFAAGVCKLGCELGRLARAQTPEV